MKEMAPLNPGDCEAGAYRISEFCKTYSISRGAFYRELLANRIKIIKRGRSTLILKSEVKNWLELCSHSAQ